MLGTSAATVARYLESASDPEACARFRELRAVAFPGFATFACIDLEALTRLGGRYRARLARLLAARQACPAAEVEGDLEHVLAPAGLGRAAFVASRIEPDATAIHHTVGVILRDSSNPRPACPSTAGSEISVGFRRAAAGEKRSTVGDRRGG